MTFIHFINGFCTLKKLSLNLWKIWIKLTDHLFIYFSSFLSDYIKALEALRTNLTQSARRLQLIATDTWDISDDLSKYQVADLLEVSWYSLTLYGWMIGEFDGWIVRCLKWLNGCMVEWLDGWMVEWLDGWIEGWLVGRIIHRWMVGLLDGWMVGRL